MGDYLPFTNIGTGRTISSLEVCLSSIYAQLDDKSLKSWGYNLYGQLGQGHTNNIGDDANEMGDYLQPLHMPSGVSILSHNGGYFHHGIVTTDGDLYLWGRGASGQLGNGNSSYDYGDDPNEMGDYIPKVNLGTGLAAVDFKGGERHTCVILSTYDLKCFGANNYGQIGFFILSFYL